jgi:hypothetical protein
MLGVPTQLCDNCKSADIYNTSATGAASVDCKQDGNGPLGTIVTVRLYWRSQYYFVQDLLEISIFLL